MRCAIPQTPDFSCRVALEDTSGLNSPMVCLCKVVTGYMEPDMRTLMLLSHAEIALNEQFAFQTSNFSDLHTGS